MRIWTRTIALCIGLAFAWVPALAGGWDKDCGQEGKAPCAWSEARFVGKQGGLCATGQFFDLIEGGTCWTCPAGTARTVFAVNTGQACEKVAGTDFKRVNEHDKGTGWFGTDCPGGQFWDIVDGKCHGCPSGYSMQVLEHVHSDRKCAKGIPGAWFSATKIGPPCGSGNLWDPRNGGECWSCPNGFNRTIAPVTDKTWACEYKHIGGGTGLVGCNDGLVSIRNVCLRAGNCGKAGQRPCTLGERWLAAQQPFPPPAGATVIPAPYLASCDPELKEDFKQNLCLALKAGESPFIAGLASVSGYLGSLTKARCNELLGGIDIKLEGSPGVGARCGRDIVSGFTCELVSDLASGKLESASTALNFPSNVAEWAGQMNTAANRTPCKESSERFAKPTRHGKATGAVVKIECPAGQFWDPDGNCYSCPEGFTRTLFPVTDDRGCTDRVGGNLRQFACGAWQFVANRADAPLDCTVEVLQDGSLFQQKLDLSKADQLACRTTGELGYHILRLGPDAAEAVVTGDIRALLGRIASVTTKSFDLKRLMQCRKQ